MSDSKHTVEYGDYNKPIVISQEISTAWDSAIIEELQSKLALLPEAIELLRGIIAERREIGYTKGEVQNFY